MNIPLIGTLLILALVVCPILYFQVGPRLDEEQMSVLKLLATIMCCSSLLCFVVGELAHNNSQVDKIWSILPFVYCWIIAVHGNMHPRLVVMAALATIWGLRLSFNFGRRGGYHIKFWEGEEDYRWSILRANPMLKNRFIWAVFDLIFICFYQNMMLLLIVLPALVCMGSTVPFGWIDGLAAALMLFFIIYETVADQQQWNFQSKKWEMINAGQKLENLPAPYNKGFNTVGLWNVSRHPNYMAEQAIWASFYVFSIGAGVGIINWSLIGPLMLILLFSPSTNLAEEISVGKYPEYVQYIKMTNRFFPGKKYRR